MTEAEMKYPAKIRETFEEHRTDIMNALPHAMKEDVDRLIMVALTATTKNPELWNCSKTSVYLSVLESARAGLMPDNKEAALIPYGGQAVFMPMVKGIINLMLRSPGLTKVEARAVYEGDHFKYRYGIDPDLDHVPAGPPAKRELEHAYAVMWRQGADPTFEVMAREEIDAIRTLSKAPNSPAWRDHFPEMARKCVLKRLSKYADLSPEATRAIELDHMVIGSEQMGQPYADGPSDEYANLVVKGQTQASLEQLKDDMGIDPNSTDPEPQETDLQIEPEQPALNLNNGEAMTPAQVKDFIRVRLDMHKGKRTHPDLIKNVAWQLGECFTGMDDPDAERHRVMFFLFKAESTKDLTGAELMATLDWLRAKKGGDEKWHPNALAAQEARAIAYTFEEADDAQP